MLGSFYADEDDTGSKTNVVLQNDAKNTFDQTSKQWENFKDNIKKMSLLSIIRKWHLVVYLISSREVFSLTVLIP